MAESRSATIRELLLYALPMGATLETGDEEFTVTWALTVRALEPDQMEIDAHDLVLVSLDMLRAVDDRLHLVDALMYLGERVGVRTVATPDGLDSDALHFARSTGMNLIALPKDSGFLKVERAVNTLVASHQMQLMNRVTEVQRQLSRLASENRDLNSLLRVLAEVLRRQVIVHDENGILRSEEYPPNLRRTFGRSAPPYADFENWVRQERDTPDRILSSPLGHTVILRVEKRVAGYLSLVTPDVVLPEFDRLILAHGADVCAMEMAKSRAIQSAVEQARGDWVQMWLTGGNADEAALTARAQQAGFDPNCTYAVIVFKAAAPLEGLLAFLRDEMSRQQWTGAIGGHVDAVVMLVVSKANQRFDRLLGQVEQIRGQLKSRVKQGAVSVGISQSVTGLVALRSAYREARGAVDMAVQLGEADRSTFYGDLKLFRLLLALSELPAAREHFQRFYQETLQTLVDQDNRRQNDFIKTLEGFFAANGNLAKAAVDLNVHRNTMVYRLERIAELSGMNLDDADNRLILYLALKVRRVLETF